MTGRRTGGAVAALLLLAAAAPAGSDGDPAGYALRLRMIPQGGARVQRLALPGAVLAALRTRDGHDVRVFDARGRAMAIAHGGTAATARRTALAAMPILGAADGLRLSDVALRLDDAGHARMAEVRGRPVDAGGTPVVLGALFDTRALKVRADRLAIAADLPEGQPVTLFVEAGDLADWRAVGQVTVYRRPGAKAPTAIADLGGAVLDGDYLRVRWTAGSRLLSPVALREALLESHGDAGADAVAVDATAPAPVDSHVVELAVPFATPIAGLRVTLAPDDGVVPVRILGRDDRERPWTPLAQGLAAAEGARPIALSGATPRTIRIEADARSGGFTAAPTLRFALASRSIVTLAAGAGPFTLAAGRADAGDPLLPPGSLADGTTVAGEARLATGPAAVLRLVAPDDAGASTRGLLLWAVLLAATAALAGLVWVLWRQRAAEATEPAG